MRALTVDEVRWVAGGYDSGGWTSSFDMNEVEMVIVWGGYDDLANGIYTYSGDGAQTEIDYLISTGVFDVDDGGMGGSIDAGGGGNLSLQASVDINKLVDQAGAMLNGLPGLVNGAQRWISEQNIAGKIDYQDLHLTNSGSSGNYFTTSDGRMWIDTDKNGRVDMQLFINHDGTTFSVDTDGDGKADHFYATTTST